MPDAAVPPSLCAAARHFSCRFAAILSALLAVVARRFPGLPRLAPLAVAVFRRLLRTRARVLSLLAPLALDRPPRTRHPAFCSRRRAPYQRGPSTRRLRLLTDLEAYAFEAAICAGQLEALLAEPESKALLAAVPQLSSLATSLLRLLGLSPSPAAAAFPARPFAPAARASRHLPSPPLALGFDTRA